MGELVMSNNWKTSVLELLTIFRGALLAIIPWLEKAKIRWEEANAYDDSDNISESLYKNIVCSSLTGEVASQYNIAKYNFNYDDYVSINFIEVKNRDTLGRKFVFVGFKSIFSPLDSVKVAEVNKYYKVVSYTDLKFDGLEFAFVKNINGNEEVIESIVVPL